MDIQTIGGIGAFITGLIGMGWAYWKNKNPQASTMVEEVLKQLSENNKADAKVIDRVSALTHAETLARFLESKGSTAGTEALQTVVREIFASKA